MSLASTITTARTSVDQLALTLADVEAGAAALENRAQELAAQLEEARRPKLPAVGVGGSGAFGGLPRAKQQEYLALMRAAGITHFRFDHQWAGSERTKGVYTFGNVVQRAQDVIAAGLIPQVLIGWAPAFYRVNAADPNSAPDIRKGALEGWRAWVSKLMAALFAVGVRRFEVWNEPNFMFMQPVSPALWASLVRIVHEEASKISRRIVVVAGGVCPAVDQPTRSQGASMFYDNVLVADPAFFQVIDELGIHPYAGDHTKLKAGQFWTKHVAHLQAIKPAELPLCGTEHGWKSGRNTEDERVALYVDTILTWTEPAPVFVFSCFDFAEPYGLLTADGTPKPVYDAIKELLT